MDTDASQEGIGAILHMKDTSKSLRMLAGFCRKLKSSTVPLARNVGFGVWCLVFLVFYWPGQRKDVEDWCKRCARLENLH